MPIRGNRIRPARGTRAGTRTVERQLNLLAEAEAKKKQAQQAPRVPAQLPTAPKPMTAPVPTPQRPMLVPVPTPPRPMTAPVPTPPRPMVTPPRPAPRPAQLAPRPAAPRPAQLAPRRPARHAARATPQGILAKALLGLLGDAYQYDQWGVGPDNFPKGKAWVTQDMYLYERPEKVPTFTVNGQTERAVMQWAFPAVDMRNLFDIPPWGPLFVAPRGLNKWPTDRYLGSDDLRWDLHPPTADNMLLAGVAGSNIPWNFQLWPADFWRLADGYPDAQQWFTPRPFPLQTFNYMALGIVPDGAEITTTARDWWERNWGLLHFMGINDRNSSPPGVGGITIYAPTDFPVLGVGGTIETQPPIPVDENTQPLIPLAEAPPVAAPDPYGGDLQYDPYTGEYYPAAEPVPGGGPTMSLAEAQATYPEYFGQGGGFAQAPPDGGVSFDEFYPADEYQPDGFTEEEYDEPEFDEGFTDEGFTDEGFTDEGFTDEGFTDEGFAEDDFAIPPDEGGW